MANVMPPATESIMSSLPREKAGVGSAVSNTVRQVGGALGVAVLGSVLAAVYRERVAAAAAGLPAPAREAALESISGAYGVAEQAGPGRRRADHGGQRRLRHRHALGGGRLGGGRRCSASSWCCAGCRGRPRDGPPAAARRREPEEESPSWPEPS